MILRLPQRMGEYLGHHGTLFLICFCISSYLHRQDFLERCDFREHENELASRPAVKPTPNVIS